MAEGTYINVNDFLEALKERGLVIVSAVEFEMGKAMKRQKLLKRKALTVKEIADNDFLPLKSKKGVMSWISSGKIKKEAVIYGGDANGTIRVLTSEILRLGYV